MEELNDAGQMREARAHLYDYELPAELIAQTPLADRAASRLLVLHKASGRVQHLHFRDLPSLLLPGDVLVLNETRVTALRLRGKREDTGGVVELLALRREPDDAYACLAKPAKRLQVGVNVIFQQGLSGTVTAVGPGGERSVRFNAPELLRLIGQAPLPPYIKMALSDSERYQTVYATNAGGGSAAAPTAGLHFTSDMLETIKAGGVSVAQVCLDVGVDTFRPVQSDDLSLHHMHGERCSIGPETARIIAGATGRIVAVGTTSARTLETFARLPGSHGRHLATGNEISKLFLRPGADLKVVDSLLTNFHLPRTTMLMMLSALAGRENVMAAYAQAIRERYRFLSFGDAMLII